MNINWYPGHMKKSSAAIRKSLKQVDVVCELVDARIPISSRNPKIEEILQGKPHLIILNKADLANPRENDRWASYFRSAGIETIVADSTKDRLSEKLYKAAARELEEVMAKRRERQVVDREIKTMVVGIPNVGKSTFINNISKRRGTKVGNRPGVTRQNQWIRTEEQLLLLDTPGVLWPKFESEQVGLHLAFTGAIKDEIMDNETLALRLVENLLRHDPERLETRYGVDVSGEPLEIMELIARKRGALIKGGETDFNKVSNILLTEFRSGILGRITLETTEDIHGRMED